MNRSPRDRLLTLLTRGLAHLFPVTRPPERVSLESVLILKPCCLGDLLLATPVIAAVRRAWPQAQIDFAIGVDECWEAVEVVLRRQSAGAR